MSLRASVLRGSMWITFGNAGQHVISFGLFIYLARILQPSDFGLVALALVFVEITSFVARLGQSEVLQRRKDLPDLTVSTSFWILAASGAAASGVMVVAASITGHFPQQALFSSVLLILSPICIFHTLNGVPEALYKRRLTLRTFAIRNIAATLIGGLVAVVLVMSGLGVFSLAAQRLATVATQSAVLWSRLHWHPRLQFGREDARALAKSGFVIMLAGSATQINAHLANMMTGLFLGTAQLGYLRLAWRVFDTGSHLLIQPIASIALSAFARFQDNPVALARAYARVTQFLALAALPLFFGMAAVADVLVPFAFGAQWVEAIPLVQLVAFIIVAGLVNYFFGAAMIAAGKSNLVLHQALVQVALTAVLLSIGLFYGVIGVMVAYIARATLISGYNLVILRRTIGLDVQSILGGILPPLISCLVMAVTVMGLRSYFEGTVATPALLLILTAAGATVYIASLWIGDIARVWNKYFYQSVGFLTDALRAAK